ncbi:MAG: TonB family protein [Prevotellaceae bacterium]|jgi:protein TonB|nr:TonB family protein [Prevotellaceae bacterium]
MSKIDINAVEWCDIVFEDRNKKFGAFTLRTKSSDRHLRALIISTILFLIAISTPILVKEVMKNIKKTDTQVRVIEDVTFDKKEPPKEEQIDLPPPPKEVMQNTVRFTPPVVARDNEVPEDEEPPTQKDLTESTTAIGTVNFNEGTDDRTAEKPKEEVQQITQTEEPEKIYDVPQQSAGFPGGTAALYEWLGKNIEYPAAAREAGIFGKVIVGFVVEKNGRVSEVKVLKGVDPALDAEAVRLVKAMPPWNPGRHGDAPVRSRFTLPITFKLQN